MALFDLKLYSNDVLVVGDSNFSFTVCLVPALKSETWLKSWRHLWIFTRCFAKQIWLRCWKHRELEVMLLSAFQNVELFHEVDATNLTETFGSRIFDQIVFYFPRTVGKSRKILEQSFASAARHVEPYRGDICVSLCQGQGGTPLDNTRRELGNVWQVVYQAAKAG